MKFILQGVVFYRIPEDGGFTTQKACTRRDIPWVLPCWGAQ